MNNCLIKELHPGVEPENPSKTIGDQEMLSPDRAFHTSRFESTPVRALKIIVCTSPPDRPQSVQDWALAEALASAGHQVTLVMDHAGKQLDAKLRGGRTERWPHPHSRTLRDAWFFWNLLGEIKPDVVISNFQSVIFAMTFASLRDVRHRIAWYRELFSQRQVDFGRGGQLQLRQRLSQWGYRLGYHSATTPIAISPASREDLVRTFGVGVERCRIFHTCRPDPRTWLQSPQPTSTPGRFKIAYAGRLVRTKGHDLLLEAFAHLVSRRPEWDLQLELIGDGALREELEARAAQLEIAAQVTFTGHVSQEEALRKLASAHVLPIPIRSDPGPGIVPEGLSLGLPIVAARIDSITALVGDSPAVKFVPPEDASALADAIESILGDSALRHRMVSESRALFERQFTLDGWVRAVAHWVGHLPSASCPVAPSEHNVTSPVS